MADFPIDLSELVDNTDDVMAKHVNNLEEKVGVDDSAVKTSIDYMLKTGWINIGALTRASDTTVTLSGDWTDRIQKGDKIRWLSDGSLRQNYVIGVSYSDPNTTITITAGYQDEVGDSIFESGEAITYPQISKIENPQGFTHLFNFTAAYAGSGSMTWTDQTINQQKFEIEGNVCRVWLLVTGTSGGSASHMIHITFTSGQLPAVIDDDIAVGCGVIDTLMVGGEIVNNVAFQRFSFIKYDRSNFGLAATVGGNGFLSYRF